jgi:hypothetical protein
MTWVAWRQYRTEIFWTLAILVALSAFLVPTGLEHHASFHDSGLKACLVGATDCSEEIALFSKNFHRLDKFSGWFNLAPIVVGLLLAAPIVIEFEHRTYRLAWTQSVTRERWLATKLGLAFFGASTFSLALTLLMTWWYAPLDRVESSLAGTFDLKGAMPFVYTTFSLALVLAVGAFSRRMTLSIPVAAVGFIAVRGLFGTFLRPGYLAPVEQITAVSGIKVPIAIPDRAWILEETFVNAARRPLSDDQLFQLCRDKVMLEGDQLAASCLEGHDVFSRILFHPVDRFWIFQAVEAVFFLTMASLLLAATVWIVRRRMS